MKVSFQKYQGAGNDFVVIDHRKRFIRRPSRLAQRLCDRHRGIGADGLLLLERSAQADYRMMYFNADGSFGGMCGNGGRCIAAFAVANRIAGPSHRFEALDHVYDASVSRSGRVRLRMKDPVAFLPNVRLNGPHGSFVAHSIDTGSPHVVVDLQKGSFERFNLEVIGRWIRKHAAFKPKGTNVNVVERMSTSALAMRTYERGVEAETLACGTGSVACAIVGSAFWGMKSPITVHTASGDRLKVSFAAKNGTYRDVILAGPAVKSFEGTIDVQTP